MVDKYVAFDERIQYFYKIIDQTMSDAHEVWRDARENDVRDSAISQARYTKDSQIADEIQFKFWSVKCENF